MSKPVAVITGASRGIGRSIAIKFASNGFDLFIGGTNPNTLKELQSELEHDFQCKCSYFAADLSVENQCQSFVDAILNQYSNIDVLVNNAGIGYFGAVEESEDDEVRRMFDINVFGLADVTNAVLPHMRNRRSGHILNIASIKKLFYRVYWIHTQL